MKPAKLKFETARTPKKIAKFAKIIIKYHLHIGGLMEVWANPNYLEDVRAITIVTRNGYPIAAGIRYCRPEYPNSLNTGIYVKQRYRRQGIGSNILAHLKIPEIKYVVGIGAYASVPFYERQKPKFKKKLLLTWNPDLDNLSCNAYTGNITEEKIK